MSLVPTVFSRKVNYKRVAPSSVLIAFAGGDQIGIWLFLGTICLLSLFYSENKYHRVSFLKEDRRILRERHFESIFADVVHYEHGISRQLDFLLTLKVYLNLENSFRGAE